MGLPDRGLVHVGPQVSELDCITNEREIVSRRLALSFTLQCAHAVELGTKISVQLCNPDAALPTTTACSFRNPYLQPRRPSATHVQIVLAFSRIFVVFQCMTSFLAVPHCTCNFFHLAAPRKNWEKLETAFEGILVLPSSSCGIIHITIVCFCSFDKKSCALRPDGAGLAGGGVTVSPSAFPSVWLV